jgi:hypothetical protein
MTTATLQAPDKSKLTTIYSGQWSHDFGTRIPDGTAVLIAKQKMNRSGDDFQYAYEVRIISKAVTVKSLESIADFFAV